MSQRPPPKPTRTQQKQQAKILDSLITPSRRINITQFKQQLKRSTRPPGITSDQLQKACGLGDLLTPLAHIYKDSNLLSELRDHQHDLATPHGSLHALHHSSESQLQSQDPSQRASPQPGDTPADTPTDIPVTSKSNNTNILPDYLDPTLFAASPSSTVLTNSKTISAATSPSECSNQKPKRIRKRAAGPPQSITHKPKPVQDLITRLSSTSLKLLQPDFDGMWYVRSVGRSDWNTSTQPMNSNLPLNEEDELDTDETPVILTITFHPFSKTSGNNQETPETKSIAPRKQTIHILSNQRLSDLRDVIVCSADKIPICYDVDGTNWGDLHWTSGSVFIIENVLFSDTRNLSDSQVDPTSGKSDYAVLLQRLLPDLIQEDKIENLTARDDESDSNSGDDVSNNINEENGSKVDENGKTSIKRKIQISSLSMEQVRFDQLTLRINEPYWMLHQGNCEHLFTIDEIRAIHPTDPSPNSSSTIMNVKKNSNGGESNETGTILTINKNNHNKEKSTSNNSTSTSTTNKTIIIKSNPYPITSFLSRISSPKCRVCDRDPAQLVTIEDQLCSESPCFICFTCFKFLHSHEDIFEPLHNDLTNPNHSITNNNNINNSFINLDHLDGRKIRWGKVVGRDWWAVPLLESS